MPDSKDNCLSNLLSGTTLMGPASKQLAAPEDDSDAITIAEMSGGHRCRRPTGT